MNIIRIDKSKMKTHTGKLSYNDGMLTITKPLSLYVPGWSLTEKLVKANIFYEVVLTANDDGLVKEIMFIEHPTDVKNCYYKCSVKNNTKTSTIGIRSVCKKYGIKPGRYKYEKLTSEPGFKLNLSKQ